MVAQRTAKRLLLGRELDYMIGEAGVTHEQVASILETRRPRIANLIDGTATITVGDLKLLATKLGFTDPDYHEVLADLRRDNHKRGFWTSGHWRAYYQDFRLMVDLEKFADLLRAVAVEIMPGLLQCESYIRALHGDEYMTAEQLARAGAPPGSVTIEDVVKARLERQRTLLGSDAPEYRVVMSESCLRREYGDAEVMLEQCKHLLAMSQRHNVSVQVVPFTVQPRTVRLTHPCVLVRVPSPGIAGPLELVYVEGESEFRYIDDNDAVKAHEAAWARLTAAALDPEDTFKFIETIMKLYH